MNDVTVLLVDDEPNLRRVLGAVLEADGYRVISAD
jgi:CheY-like chemotaxis protein